MGFKILFTKFSTVILYFIHLLFYDEKIIYCFSFFIYPQNTSFTLDCQLQSTFIQKPDLADWGLLVPIMTFTSRP